MTEDESLELADAIIAVDQYRRRRSLRPSCTRCGAPANIRRLDALDQVDVWCCEACARRLPDGTPVETLVIGGPEALEAMQPKLPVIYARAYASNDFESRPEAQPGEPGLLMVGGSCHGLRIPIEQNDVPPSCFVAGTTEENAEAYEIAGIRLGLAHRWIYLAKSVDPEEALTLVLTACRKGGTW